MIFGVTGCPGSGKSIFSRTLESLGWTLVDADKMGHEVVNNDTSVLESLMSRFGRDIVLPDGRLDRRTLGLRAFSTPDNTKDLNEIVHPALIKKIQNRLNELRTEKKDTVVDCALIFEWEIGNFFDIIICVTADENKRRQRIIDRDSRTVKDIDGIFAAQLSQEIKAAKSDIVLRNDSTPEKLEAYGKMVSRLPELLAGV